MLLSLDIINIEYVPLSDVSFKRVYFVTRESLQDITCSTWEAISWTVRLKKSRLAKMANIMPMKKVVPRQKLLINFRWGATITLSTLVQVIVWCRQKQKTCHCLSQCWHRHIAPFSVTSLVTWYFNVCLRQQHISNEMDRHECQKDWNWLFEETDFPYGMMIINQVDFSSLQYHVSRCKSWILSLLDRLIHNL